MEMFQIRYVLAAARFLNFTKAAASCKVSQPALTKAIKTLEAELGAPLFHREGKRVLLSDFGKSILPNLQHILDEAEVTLVKADNFRLLIKVPIRLGVMSTVGHGRIANFLAQFQEEFSGVELSVSEAGLRELEDKLQDGDLDIAIMNPLDGLDDRFNASNLYGERYLVVLPFGHRLSNADTISLSDLSGEPYVDRLACEMREMVMATCQQTEVELYARFRSEREDWVQAMVMAGIGFAFMPEHSITLPQLVRRPLVNPSVSRKIALVTVPGRPHSPATAAMVRAARSFNWTG